MIMFKRLLACLFACFCVCMCVGVEGGNEVVSVRIVTACHF